MIADLHLPAGDVWNVVQGSEAWENARKGRATASEAKNILTPTGRLSSQAEAYARRLVRETVLDDPLRFTGNKATDWGHEHEPEARALYAERIGREILEVGFVTQKRNPILGASPDGLILDPEGVRRGLEIKCPSIDKLIAWAIEGILPEEHLPQVRASMVVTGLRQWDFVGYHPGAPLFVPPPAEWDEETDRMAEALDAFVELYAEVRPQVLELLGVNTQPEPEEEALL